MPVGVLELKSAIEDIAPIEYAFEWDNSGFQINLNNETAGVLVCLDVTPEIIREAAGDGFSLILAHHPLLFRPLSAVDSKSYVGQCVSMLIESGISLYSAHTSADNSPRGINFYMAGLLGLSGTRFLAPLQYEEYCKAAVSAPVECSGGIIEALKRSGAGTLGEYTGCTFAVEGEGSFIPGEKARPYIGHRGGREYVKETLIQALVPKKRFMEVIEAIKSVHPYEEPAIDVFELAYPKSAAAGPGVIGEAPDGACVAGLIEKFKEELDIGCMKLRGDPDAAVTRVAVCGGSGGDLIDRAVELGAQLYITGELKHSHYLRDDIAIAEAGHYDTEKCFCRLMAEGLRKSGICSKNNIAVKISEAMERPYMYCMG